MGRLRRLNRERAYFLPAGADVNRGHLVILPVSDIHHSAYPNSSIAMEKLKSGQGNGLSAIARDRGDVPEENLSQRPASPSTPLLTLVTNLQYLSVFCWCAAAVFEAFNLR